MRIVVMNDPHFSTVPLGDRSKDYARDILRKMMEIFSIAKRKKADFVVCTGDIFGRRNPTARDAYILAGAFCKSDVEVVGIFGNHDIAGYNLKSMETRLSGVLARSGAYHLLDDGWVERDDVVLTGMSYCTDYDVHRLAYLKDDLLEEKTTIKVTHGMVLTNDGDFPWAPYTNANWFRENVKRLHDVIVNGHYHIPQKPLKIGRKMVYSDGSMSRISRDQDYIPGVRYLEVIAGKGVVDDEWIELKMARPYNEIFLESGSRTEQRDAIREFAESVGRETASMAVSGDRELVGEIVRKMGYGKEVENEVLKYMEV